MRTRITERYIPTDATGFINEEAKTAVYCYGAEGVPLAIGYSAKRKKPDFHLRFKSTERRDEYIKEYEETKLKFIKDKADWKAEQKVRADKDFAGVKVGDIFHSSWGWEQTNNDFVQLIELKGKTGTFRALGSETVETLGWASENVKVVPNIFYGEPFKKRLKGDSFNQSSFQHFSKVEDPENKTFYDSSYA